MKILKLLVLLLFVVVISANSADDPHGSVNSIECGQCHITHSSMGDILVNATDSLVSTLCISCHTPGGWIGMSKYISSSLKAQPGISGTSHAWDVDTANVNASATSPTSQTLLDHLTVEGRITCGTCHNPHSNANPPFLRLDNSADQLCLDCHSARNNTSVKTYTGNELSHPIGQALPATETWHNPPLDVDGNPQPSDGNTSNDYILGAGNEVRCTSCHGVHNKDSNSGTVD